MGIVYSNKPQLLYNSDGNYVSRLPMTKLPPARNWQGMQSAPMGSRPVILATSSGTQVWGMHHRDAWRKVEIQSDWKTGQKRYAMTPISINPVAWRSS